MLLLDYLQSVNTAESPRNGEAHLSPAAGQILKQERRNAGIKLDEAAQRLGMASYELLAIEDGEAELPLELSQHAVLIYTEMALLRATGREPNP